MSKLARLLPFAAAALLAGCSVGPAYVAPAPAAPAAFAQAAPAIVRPEAPLTQWWSHFNDPVLDRLVADALARNHDLRVARARLDEARALRREAAWAFAPQGAVQADWIRGRRSEAEAGFAPTAVNETWSAGFDAAWELDLFGRNRRAHEAARAELEATAAVLRGTQVAVLAEVAASYFSLRGTEESLALVSAQVAALQTSHALTARRLEAGRGTELDTARTESLLRETESLLPVLERDAALQRHRLAVLLGESPGAFTVPAPREPATAPATLTVAIGSPADLLRRRPDIQAAERTLAAATARVGVSTAALFPEVSLRGVFRFVGLNASDLGEAGTRSWAVAPTLQWRLLDYGQLRARLAASRARADGALAAYEATVLRALEDTENALTRYRAALARTDLLESRHAAAHRALGLAQRQEEAGATDSLARLDAERTALGAGRDALAARTERHLALVALYKALGGT